MSDKIFFISDLHLGKDRDEKKKIKKLFSFFDYIVSRASILYIVGDFFDFYFEYRTQIPKMYYEVYRHLSNLIDNGIEIHYFIGNHDYWLRDFLESIGLIMHRTSEKATLHGKRIYIAHGNGMISFDPGDLLLRNRFAISLFYLLHPDLAYKIGSYVSRLSRSNSQKKDIRWKKLYSIAKKIFEDNIDMVILGHIHEPIHKRIDGHDFILLGDWTEHFTYAMLNNGRISLHKF
ncbi:UDP-2,3-diacylglucosamine diphosphatase [candidate division WOR-3 bacterium]|nr:UDP-2,3-diacylglucosamine diphosphatase [candidate division WOR-3 bacterium]